MELFSPEFFSALLAIVLIDLVLAGDNAIVIALAARNLPAHLRTKAIVWGSVGAVVVRSLMTFAVVWLLKIPGLLLVGGLLLLWIAYKLLHSSGEDTSHVGAAGTFAAAMKTIVIADAVMGVDNVLAVAGAAHGDYLLVVLGLLISIPIVVGGSSMLLKLTQRFPIIVTLGSAVLVVTGVKMALNEPLVKAWFEGEFALKTAIYVVALAVVLFSGYLRNQVSRMRQAVKAHAKVRLEFRRNTFKGAGDMEKVLVPVDGSENALAAVRQVIADASRNRDREVVLLNVQPALPRHISRFLKRSDRNGFRQQRADAAFASAGKLLQASGIAFSTHTRVGERAQSISEFAKESGCDKIVVGTARKNSLSRLVQNSVTARLLENAPVPVQVVMGRNVSALERIGVPAGVAAALTTLVLVID